MESTQQDRIAAIVQRHGYRTTVRGDVCVVLDPVRNCDNQPKVTGWNEIKLPTVTSAIRFLGQRS